MTNQYWKIECTERMETIFEAKISVKHISEKRLMEFMRTLIAKYILEPEEILDEYRTIPFRKKKEHVHITRTNEKMEDKMLINFMADSAGISIIAYLLEET